MPQRLRWFDRDFAFDFSPELARAIVERLRGTPARIEERLRTIPESRWTERRGDSWSIQENVGHLLDLEPLWAGRLDDLLSGAATLRPADLTNRKTAEAGHNHRSMADLAHRFRAQRLALVGRLDGLENAAFERTSRHPRLDQPMRLVDLLYFTAEHDDWHLAEVTAIATRT